MGEYQHIVYRHFLPRLLGREVMTRHGVALVAQSSSSSAAYSDRVNPSIKNEFSTAAFRYGHSAVQVSLLLIRVVHDHRFECKISKTIEY